MNIKPLQLAIPSPEQAAWQDLELGMFIHYAPNTWCNEEKDDLSVPLDRINPAKLDTEQWVRVAEAMGARYIVFVAKHVGGFCWWPTVTTDYSVKGIPWRDGKGDVMRDLSESCRRRGMKLGVYLSPADGKHGAGICGKCKTEAEQEAYDRVYRQQLTELLSGYGELMEVWFDGSLVVEVGDILKKHAPHAMIFQGKYATIRWIGTESGHAPYPAWNAVSSKKNPTKWDVMTAFDGDPNADKWLPNEVGTVNAVPHAWFWNALPGRCLKTLDELMEVYYRSVGHGAVLLLNQTPDPSGLIPEADAKLAAGFGAEIKRRFGQCVAESKGTGDVLELDLGEIRKIDHVITMEDITRGERVREYVIEGYMDGAWKKICQGTAIGHKKIDFFKQVKVRKIRLRNLLSADTPVIRKLAVYNTGAALILGVDHDPDTGIAIARSAEQNLDKCKYRRIGSWNQGSFKKGKAVIEMDVTSICSDATQYEIAFQKISGAEDVNILELSFVFEGIEVGHFIQPTHDSNVYDLNVTGLGKSMVLRATISSGGGSDTCGDILIRHKPLD